MSTQLIDFESGSVATGDSGERADSDAIKPVDAGEGVKAAVIDRPFENLRARTEELRKKVEELLYRADADKWIITGGNISGQVIGPTEAFPTVTWDATTGRCTVSEPIIIQPFVAPNTDLFGSLEYEFDGGTDTFLFESNDAALASDILFDYQLANSIRIIWETSGTLGGGVYCVATFEGTPEHILRIIIRNDGTTKASHVETELNTIMPPTVPAAILKFSLTGPGTTFLDLTNIAGREDVHMTNAYSREFHFITKTTFDNFFIGSPLSVEGDGVGIWYEELVDSVPTQHGGRRQATPMTAIDVAPNLPPNTEVPGTKFFKFSTEPEKIPGCIPLCRRIGTYLVFIDGTVVEHGHTATLGGEGAIDDLLARYVAHIGGLSAEKHAAGDITSTPYSWIAASNVGAGINEIVDDLAHASSAADGASKVGLYQIAGTPESIGNTTTRAAISAIYGHLNARTERASVERVTQTWDMFSEGTVATSSSAMARLRGEVFISTLTGGSWPRGTTIYDIASRLPGANSLAGPTAAANTLNPTLLAGIYLAGHALIVRDSISYPGRQQRILAIVRSSAGVAGSGMANECYQIDPSNSDTIAATTVILGSLPTGSARTWQAKSCCSSGSVLFVLFHDPITTEWRVQAYDATDVALPRLAAWPSTGIDPTPTFVGTPSPGSSRVRTYNIVMASSSKVATLNGHIDLSVAGRPAISVFNASDGDPLTMVSGDGDVTAAAGVLTSGGLCSDGTNLYWTSVNNSTGVTKLNSAQISAPNSGRVAWSIPTLGTEGDGTENFCYDLCWTGAAVVAPCRNGTIRAYPTEILSATLYSEWAAHPTVAELRRVVFDGLRVWMFGVSVTSSYVALSMDASLMEHPAIIGVGSVALVDVCSIVSLMSLEEAGASPTAVSKDMGLAIFDGDAVWACLNDGQAIGSAKLRGYIRAIRASSRR